MGIELRDSGTILEIIACYRPPNENYASLEAISEKIENTHRHPIVIAGDLNVPEANWKGAVSEAKVQQLVNRLVGGGLSAGSR